MAVCGIKGIFFDAGDTLFEPRETIGATYCRVAEKYGVHCDVAWLNGRFLLAFEDSPPLAFPKVSARERQSREYRWWHRLVQIAFEGLSFPAFDPFFEELYRYFGSASAWVLFPETKAVLSRLKDAGYYLGMISNFDSRLPAICRHLGIADYFNEVTYSSLEGYAKPAPEIFASALKAANLRPAASMHLGDKLENDVQGARQVGMTPILVDRVKGLSGDGQLKVISNLQEIDRYL